MSVQAIESATTLSAHPLLLLGGLLGESLL